MIIILQVQPFSAYLEHLTQRRKIQLMTTQMLLNSKCLDMLVLHNEYG